jgi:hypothetical protein
MKMTARHTLAGLAVAAALALVLAGPASPARASGNYYQVIGIASVSSSDVSIAENANINSSRTRIWLVPGSLSCVVFGKGTVTWCGVASGNGTFTIDSGLNYQWRDSAGTLHKFYLRYDISANGTCVTRGDFNAYTGAICGG